MSQYKDKYQEAYSEYSFWEKLQNFASGDILYVGKGYGISRRQLLETIG